MAIRDNNNGTWSCHPPTYAAYTYNGLQGLGSPLTWTSQEEAFENCGAEMVSPSGNAMPIQDKQTYEQKKGLGKRNVANRVKKRTQGFSGDWYNAQGGAQRGTPPQPSPIERDLGCKKICVDGPLVAGNDYYWVNGEDCECDGVGGQAPGPRIMSKTDANYFRKNFQKTRGRQYAPRRR